MHNIHYRSYPENVNKKTVQADWDHQAAMEDWQEGCSGLPDSIKWHEKTFESEEEARAYIEKIDSGWYDQIAVKYKEYPRVEINRTKKHQEIINRIDRLTKERAELNNNVHYKDVKAAFVSCPNCQSKIARAYIKSNTCPVCRAEMRPKSTLDRLKSYSDRIKEAEKLASIEEKLYNEKIKAAQTKKKPKVYWLVKVEYHT